MQRFIPEATQNTIKQFAKKGNGAFNKVKNFFDKCVAFCKTVKAIVKPRATKAGKATLPAPTQIKIKIKDPLVLDLGADGILVINQEDSNAFFDMELTGFLSHVSWITPSDAFLCRDTNGNGVIDDARELFSSATVASARTGFEALATFDANKDGVVDAADPVFSTLLVWTDLNMDGVSDKGELKPLADFNVTALPVAKISIPQASPNGDFLFGGDAVVRAKGEKPVFLFEVGLTVVADPLYVRALDVASLNGARRYFARDQSKLLVLTKATSVDLGKEEAATLFGSEGDDTIKTSSKLPVFVKASGGDDVITGSSRPDMLDGGPGKDEIRGGGGNDILWIDADDTVVNGGDGLDVVIVEGYGAVTLDMFKSEVEVLYSGPGDDTITMSGGKYGVRVLAGAGADKVTTSEGDDYIDGGPGDDTIDAGAGDSDTVIFSGDFSECVNRAVQFQVNGGQFDFVRSSARTMHPQRGVRVDELTKSSKIPTRKILPLRFFAGTR